MGSVISDKSHSSMEEGGNRSRTSSSGSTGRGNDEEASPEIAKSESAKIFKIRFLVLFALLLAAVGVSVAVYMITSKSEQEEYLTQYEGSASKVITSFEDIVSQKLAAIGSLSITATSYVRSQPDMNWPFVTIEDFNQLASMTRELSNTLFVRIVPVVQEEDRLEWEKYAVENGHWVQDARDYNADNGLGPFLPDVEDLDYTAGVTGIPDRIFTGFSETGLIYDEGTGPYYPLWQESPTFGRDQFSNWNMAYYPPYADYVTKSVESGEIAIGGIDTADPGTIHSDDLTIAFYALMQSMAAGYPVPYEGDPMSTIFVPIFDSFEEDRKPTALIFALMKWATYFEDLLPPNSPGVMVVLENTCEGPFTYKVVGDNVEYMGKGNLHNPDFSHWERSVDFDGDKIIKAESSLGIGINQDLCKYKIRVYPSEELYDEYHTNLPIIITCAVALAFVVTAGVFILYNHLVEQRQKLVMNQAVKSTAIVSSLFPEGVRDRLLMPSGKNRLKSFLQDGDDDEIDETPIADLFPHTTVFFADIAGFTAWSSTREPQAVFTLLQSLYQAFDVIAKRRKVFKVETIGDSYVAVCGLPNPDNQHFVKMARFAVDCLAKFSELVKKLEQKLGPDTGELGLRVGLNSGPVTAGVLRGERSRFQLFGDTVNTAARMESSGVANRIQLSEATAKLLISAGKGHWLKSRQDNVDVKGKGIFETYWLEVQSKQETTSDASVDGVSAEKTENGLQSMVPQGDSKKHERLVTWITDLLLVHVRKVVVAHDAVGMKRETDARLVYTPPEGTTCLDEVTEVIKLPKFDVRQSRKPNDYTSEMDPIVVTQLRQVVATIACLYRGNDFHNFEHACHVTMCVEKFLSRIVTPDMDEKDMQQGGLASKLHDYTHGINSDPLTLLAIVFSALIHDADHRGISNAQLCKEDKGLASAYRSKSVAEQNSLDIAWEILMADDFKELRATIFGTRTELLRFRQVIVNVVLATDIFDKELNDLRKKRWDLAFGKDQNNTDLRATIVIEHLIQASDVSHTMQHWHIYRKWNERLFMEMYTAYQQGRMGADPSTFWYKGEIGFFDNYIIPLAKKLKDCNVFGVSSDECLNYAMKNRHEWETRGQEIVAGMMQKVQAGVVLDPPEAAPDHFL